MRYRQCVFFTLWMLGACSSQTASPDVALSFPADPMGYGDASNPQGLWNLSLAPHQEGLDTVGTRRTLTLEVKGGRYVGTLGVEGEQNPTPVDQIRWNSAERLLEFRYNTVENLWQWYRGRIVEGLFIGRYSQSESPDKPALISDYSQQVTGWNTTFLDRDIVPRVFDIKTNIARLRLRIDRALDGSNGFQGSIKAYAKVDGSRYEEPEYELTNIQWDGANLRFVRAWDNVIQRFTGVVSGRLITGTYEDAYTSVSSAFSGVRTEVLSPSMADSSPVTRSAWQERTRKQLQALMMDGNPAPLSTAVSEFSDVVQGVSVWPPERDDNPISHPQNYTVTQLNFSFQLPGGSDGVPLVRAAHGYLALPSTSLPSQDRKPAVLVLNGHNGGAYRTLDPNDVLHWYGDAFARRGFIVLALDISHRPFADRSKFYIDVVDGDDPTNGNGSHPAIAPAGMNSDWEEDGERTWDAMRGLDYLLQRTDVDPARIIVVGQDMGGEVAMILGALDPRPSLTVSSLFANDLAKLHYNGNHLCFLWTKADIHEYVDTSTFYSMIAPRLLLLETGVVDKTYSSLGTSGYFAGDKQEARRIRALYGRESDRFVHYLHYDGHRFHVGDLNPTAPTISTSPDPRPNVRIPVRTGPTFPIYSTSYKWQTDPTVQVVSNTLFTLIDSLLSGGQ